MKFCIQFTYNKKKKTLQIIQQEKYEFMSLQNLDEISLNQNMT